MSLNSSTSTAARLRLTLLGRFAAVSEGAPPGALALSSPRHRALLGYLAMQPGYGETRERLAALLWSDRSDKQARQSLRQSLLTLKQDLEEADSAWLAIERDSVRLNGDQVDIDARRLLALSQSPDPAQWPDLAGLSCGPFLDGLSIDSEGFEEWVRAERVRVAAAAEDVFRRYCAWHDEAGRGALAVLAAERLVSIDPTREDAQRLLLRLLWRYSGPEAALSQASLLAEVLASQLDSEPEAETAALIAEIRTACGRSSLKEGALKARARLPSEDSVPPPARPQAHAPKRHRLIALAVTACAAAVLLGVWVANAPSGSQAPAATVPAGDPDAGWRSPSILAGVSADHRTLAAQGVFAIVVLPFVAQTPQSDAEKALAGRITDDLTSDLSRVPAFRVIARQTSRIYAGHPIDVAAIGSELGVRYVIEGSVRLHDGRVRINAAMVDPHTRLQVWSERFDRPENEQVAAQDELVRSIARHLHVGVYTAEQSRRGPPRAGDAEIDALLAQGWRGIVHIPEDGTTSGADLAFQEVLRRQPRNISATLGLAGYRIGIAAAFLTPDHEAHLAEAEELLRRVLAINPRSGMANYFRGVLHKLRGQPNEALAAFTSVLDLNPSFPMAYANAGHVMSRTGRLDVGMEHVRYAIRLSPKDPGASYWNLFAGEIELERGRDDAAAEWLRRAAELSPRAPFPHAALAAAVALRGDMASARLHAQRQRSVAPWLTLEMMVDRVTETSAKGFEPQRLIQGLRKAFGPAG